MSSLFDFVNAINDKNYIFDERLDSGSTYNQYMIAQAMSNNQDTILFANEVNRMELSNKVHFDFLFHAVTKKKRYGKWAKKDKADENAGMIIEYFKCNHERASEILGILTEGQINEIRDSMNKGGKG